MSGYCDIAPQHPVHGRYHDTEYGFPAADERVLFERLALEIMQAGLSWEIVLKKRRAMNRAFDRFLVRKVAAYQEKDVRRLLADEGIIRNRLKIKAIITNANRLLELRRSHGGFAAWIEAHHPRKKEEWVKLFRQNFSFVGGEIVGEFLMSLGVLPGAHRDTCPVYKVIRKERPLFLRQDRKKSV